MQCPKCGYVRLATDVAPEWQCPSCQVAYAKAKAQIAGQAPVAAQRTPAPEETDEAEEYAALAASGQKIVIYSIILNFILRAVVQQNMLSPLAVTIVALGVAAFSLFGVLRVCSALKKGQNLKLVIMALSCMPWINLITLVVLNAKATKLLRSAGWRVGLLGARP